MGTERRSHQVKAAGKNVDRGASEIAGDISARHRQGTWGFVVENYAAGISPWDSSNADSKQEDPGEPVERCPED